MQEVKIIETALETIRERSLPEGGFAMYCGESFRPDVTAWAVLALKAGQEDQKVSTSACQRLAQCQNLDGRISVIDSFPMAYWPTSIAIIAWKKATGFDNEIDRAAQFLVKNTGKHWPKKKTAPVDHDTAIKGWPWIQDTHSWIEPTALAILALRSCGYSEHQRVLEAVKMILDRQLPSGGWNYGNKIAFDKKLKPIPESTSHALASLSGLIEKEQIQLSLEYLKKKVPNLRTPLALSWAIFGMSSWSNRPANFQEWILESLNLQKKYGSYDTGLLSQLLVAYFTEGDLIGFLMA